MTFAVAAFDRPKPIREILPRPCHHRLLSPLLFIRSQDLTLQFPLRPCGTIARSLPMALYPDFGIGGDFFEDFRDFAAEVYVDDVDGDRAEDDVFKVSVRDMRVSARVGFALLTPVVSLLADVHDGGARDYLEGGEVLLSPGVGRVACVDEGGVDAPTYIIIRT